MFRIALNRAKKAYQAKYGLKHTNKSLAKASTILEKMATRAPGCEGLFCEVSIGALESMGGKGFYNASLKPLGSLCYLLHITPEEFKVFLEYAPEWPVVDAAAQAPGQVQAPDSEAEAEVDRKPDGESRMPISLDPVSKAVVEVIQMNDYVVDVKQVGEAYRCTAKHRGGETLTADGADLFRTICDLAEAAEIELEDG